ncbi:hypothetical protein OH492_13290 [Vibrio chagasii]|nr:hypothetical protein [Vibrio chagasii]
MTGGVVPDDSLPLISETSSENVPWKLQVLLRKQTIYSEFKGRIMINSGLKPSVTAIIADDEAPRYIASIRVLLEVGLS